LRWSDAGHGSGAGHGAAQDTMQAWDMERHGPSSIGMLRGTSLSQTGRLIGGIVF
jgi:hypothetical protein